MYIKNYLYFGSTLLNKTIIDARLSTITCCNVYQITKKYYNILYQQMSSDAKVQPRFNAILDKDIDNKIEEEIINPRDHPGTHVINCVYLPSPLVNAIGTLQKEHSMPDLLKEAKDLYYFIQSRQPPLEDCEMTEKVSNITSKLIESGRLKSLEVDPLTDPENLKPREQKLLKLKIKSETYQWSPIKYTDYKSLVYLTARMAPDFASLVKIFAEIKSRIPDFQPRSLFDFGSGVGSVTWATEEIWPDVCDEAYCVDSSSSMLDLSQRLIREAYPCDEEVEPPFGAKKKYYRQFLPGSDTLKYDLVVSSRSLFEVGNLAMRARIVDILWKKVNPEGFLVLVEDASRAGHKILMEVRDFLLETYNSSSEGETKPSNNHIQVFSPCPHEKFCPRIFHRSKTSCNFSVCYQPLYVGRAVNEYYSFVVFRKLSRTDNEPEYWPRVVQPVLKRSRIITTRLCTPEGEIAEKIFTKGKHSKNLLRLAKSISWGDRLPIISNQLNKMDAPDNEE